MHRDDWEAVYLNQDRILQGLKGLGDKIFLAGGTGLQRFVLPRAYRHSEDLDFFFPALQTKSYVLAMGKKIETLICKIPGASVEQSIWIKDDGAYRVWCRFDDNEEIVKVELLNFTCARLKDINFINHPFKTENLYNLLLYKLKALCDRPDTIKDLFDLYFIFRELPEIVIENLIADLNAKFEEAIGLRYEREYIIRALEHDLKWNIEIADIKHTRDLKEEIDAFQVLLQNALKNENTLDFSYAKRIKENAKRHDLEVESYIELIDVLEDNAFWVDEVRISGIANK